MKKINILLVLVVLIAIALPLKADIYIEQENKTSKASASEAGKDTIIKMWISEKAIRVEEPGGNMVNIVDLENRQIITLDSKNKEYFVIPLSEVHERFAKASSNLKRRMQMRWRVENLSDVEMVSGYKCFRVRFHGLGVIKTNSSDKQMKVTLDYWVSDATPIPDDLAGKLLDVMGMNNNPLIDKAILDELGRLNGYPVKFITTMERDSVKDVVEQTVTKIEEVTVDPGFYSIPMDYNEVSSPVNR